MMVEAMKRRGLPVAYLAFEGEQHGFRKADTIKRTLESRALLLTPCLRFSSLQTRSSGHDREPGELTHLARYHVAAKESQRTIEFAKSPGVGV